jgi:hypothetical protein
MANHESNSESKSINNLLIVDPNPCGRDLINIEDLNISVELEVHRRSDDIIIFTSETDTVEAKTDSKFETTTISFIDGDNNIEKGLTTHYTELNSQFNKTNSELGTLGIETIDINFNTSYTPMVKMKFKDIRGKLVEMGNDSPYAFLFRMPYPIFYLTIKGYYGQPVRYALHMTKFNGALDGKTGSFVITCDFIGYTYAFLSDLLMGIVKAIPYTITGEKLIKNDSDFITFEALGKKISELETLIINYKNNDEKLRALTIFKDLSDRLDEIKNSLLLTTTINDSKVIFDPNIDGDEFVSFNNKLLRSKDREDYKTFILDKIDEYNEFNDDVNSGDYKLEPKDFALDNKGVYHGKLDLNVFKKNKWDSGDEDSFQNTIEVHLLTNYKKVRNVNESSSINKLIEAKYDNFVNIINSTEFTIDKTNPINVLDFRFAVQKIEDLKTEIEKSRKEAKNKVTEEFVGTINEFLKNDENLQFDASIGAFFEILTKHVDLFLAVIKNVETEIHTEIQSLGNSRKINTSNNSNFTEYPNPPKSNTTQLKPFPEYVEENKDGIFEDRWLGSNIKFANFKEVRFINELYDAMQKERQKQLELLNTLEIENSGWLPVNPMDTKIIHENMKNPWANIKDLTPDPIIKLVVQRMALFLGYSYKNLTDNEIDYMAKIEAEQSHEMIRNPQVKNAIINSDDDEDGISKKIKTWIGTGTDGNYGVLGEKYSLKFKTTFEDINAISMEYIHDAPERIPTYIPISQSISELKNEINSLYNLTYRNGLDNTSEIFTSSLVGFDAFDTENGETTLKIIDENEYENALTYKNYIKTDSSNVTSTISNIDRINNFNKIDGGIFKTHEFRIYEHKSGKIPFFYEFYKNGGEIVNEFRKDSITTVYDTFSGEKNNREFNNINNTPNLKIIDSESNRKDFQAKIGVKFDKKLKDVLVEVETGKDSGIINYKFQPTFKSKGLNYSLFGSDLYYSQTSEEAKAFLFLHTIPFIGLHHHYGSFGANNDKGLLQSIDINFFNQRAGFIQGPYSWVLFMGGLLYRMKQDNDIIPFTDNENNSLIPNDSNIPDITKNTYLTPKQTSIVNNMSDRGSNLSFWSSTSFGGGSDYSEINNIIKFLPSNTKSQFINEFTEWVKDGWLSLKKDLEIFDNEITPTQRKITWENITSSEGSLKSTAKDNYNLVSKDGRPNDNSNSNSNFFLDLYDEGSAAENVMDFLLRTKIIANGTYRIWEGKNYDYSKNDGIIMSPINVDKYLTAFFRKFRELNKDVVIDDKEKELNQNIFNTTNVDDIKLGLYKNIKSIYDKWIVGVHKESESVITENLFSRFRFIDRSYADISSEFKISPKGFIDFLKSSHNMSFYNFIARILQDNNFDFIPLPTFIDFNNKDEVKKVFEPVRFNEMAPTSGPQFICMYLGEHSNRLPLGETESRNKKDDGFFIDGKCIDNEFSITSDNIPPDFKEENRKIPYFLVNYADQNQSMFKSYKLDQLEFTETNESLQIIEDISNGNRNSSVGQNLFDIYNNRSYSVEVEMLGCAQIQPFMYFQLNNIPMFYGAYTIINTTHHIKPNHMTTTFKGVRIRKVKTKMVDDETLYLNLIGNLNDVSREGANLDDLKESTKVNTSDHEAKIYKSDNPIFDDSLTPINTAELNNSKINEFINSVKVTNIDAPLIGQDYIDLSIQLRIPLELMLLQAAQESNFGTKGAATSTHNIFNILNITEGDTLTPEEAKRRGYRKDYGDWVVGVKAYANTIKSYIPDDGDWLRLLDYDKFRRKDYNARYAADKDYEGALRTHKRNLEVILNS